MNAYVIIWAAFFAVVIGLVFVVAFPLLGMLTGGVKILLARKRYGTGWEGAFHFDRRLGFTMADGGEKKEKE
jgi:large-conductance mechanosensitive channel